MAVRGILWVCPTLIAVAAASAAATEVCVKCTGPDASYACIVNAASGGRLDTASNLYCITALAKFGPHESCSIDRNTRPPCQGERRELPIPAALEGAVKDFNQEATAPAGQMPASDGAHTPADESQHDAGTPPEHADAPPQNDPNADNKPPKTVQEMVEKSSQSGGDNSAIKSAGTALQKAGTAVGDAAKTSWKCLSSFFSKC